MKRNNSIISYNIKSSIWTSIRESYIVVLENTTWIIGNGSKVNCWLDTWTEEPLANRFTILAVFHNSLTTMVKDWLINKTWCVPLNVQAALPCPLPLISATHIPDSEMVDSIIWRDSLNGELS